MPSAKPKARIRKRAVRGRGSVNRLMAVTTYRIYADQRDALQRAALERRAGGAGGRADASALLREILDKVKITGDE